MTRRVHVHLSFGRFKAQFACVGMIASAHAQNAPSAERNVETVIVTGSHIRVTPEDSALPVDVVTADDLETQGSPTLVQLVKHLPAASGGAVGESNRYLGNSAGSASVNLRGFGAARTMVLLNGRRMAASSTARSMPSTSIRQRIALARSS